MKLMGIAPLNPSYARVCTDDQNLDLQRDALTQASRCRESN
jgi:hypothetical protein